LKFLFDLIVFLFFIGLIKFFDNQRELKLKA
jgi:hypothetical protein